MTEKNSEWNCSPMIRIGCVFLKEGYGSHSKSRYHCPIMILRHTLNYNKQSIFSETQQARDVDPMLG